MTDIELKLKNIADAFKIEGDFVSCVPHGEGHINTTYKLTVNDGGKIKTYILQKINHNLFTNVDNLMSNIYGVTEFARAKIIERGGDPNRETLTVILTKDDKTYYFDGEGYYRVFIFIEDTIAYQKPESAEVFASSAYSFGKFANLLAEYPAEKLYEIFFYFNMFFTCYI